MSCDHPPACPPCCTHCLAYDRITGSLCSQAPASSSSKWCPVHEMLQAKLLKSYKRLTYAVDAFDDSTLPPSGEAIELSDDLPQLRLWSECSRKKWILAQRVIVARDDHHRHFYQGGDSGHSFFIGTLKLESNRLEKLMQDLERRAYAVTLANTEAEWILSVPSAVGFVCDEKSEPTAPLTPPPSPPTTAAKFPSPTSRDNRKRSSHKGRKRCPKPAAVLDDSASDFWKEVHRKVCRPASSQELLLRLREYLVPPCTLPTTIQTTTWVEVISTLFRHVILRVPSLALIAFSGGSDGKQVASVVEFLDVLEERETEETDAGEAVKGLWTSMKFAKSSGGSNDAGLLGVEVLGNAISDAFRSEDDAGKSVELLGGKVFANSSKAAMPAEAWDLFYQFIGCAGCSLSVTNTFSCWSRNRRLALLGSYPAWLSPNETPADHIFRAAGIVLATGNANTCCKKIKRVEQKVAGKKGGKGKKTVLVENWERAWMYCKLPLGTSETATLLSTFQACPDLVLVARNLETDELTHIPFPPSADTLCRVAGCQCMPDADPWLARVRSGLSPAERKAASWSMSTYFSISTVLDSFHTHNSPERRFSRTFLDAHDILLLDNRSYDLQSGDWESFHTFVGTQVLKAKGCGSLKDLILKERGKEKGCQDGGGAGGGMTGRVELKREEGVVYAAFDEVLKAREMFRESD